MNEGKGERMRKEGMKEGMRNRSNWFLNGAEEAAGGRQLVSMSKLEKLAGGPRPRPMYKKESNKFPQ
jgi:hypothetical protein